MNTAFIKKVELVLDLALGERILAKREARSKGTFCEVHGIERGCA